MTDQVPTEYVRFRGESYILLTTDATLFSLWDHGIHPEDTESSNWAGFVAHFQIRGERLYLDYLRVAHTPAARKRLQRSHFEMPEWTAALDDIIGDYTLPLLNGVEASDAGMSYWHYRDIELALDYSGSMSLASDSSPQQPEYLQLAFEKGRLVSSTSIPAPKSNAGPRDEIGPSDAFDFANPRARHGQDSDPEPPQDP